MTSSDHNASQLTQVNKNRVKAVVEIKNNI